MPSERQETVSTDAESVGADPRYYVASVARAAHVLKAVADHNGPVSLARLAKHLVWNKAAVYRIVRTLDALGFLRSTDGGYVPGPALITLGQAALEATGLLPVARPHLEALSEELVETVVLTVLDGPDIVYVDCIEVEAVLMTRSTVGAHLPAYCTCSGQVQLAGLTDSEVRKRLSKVDMLNRGPNTLSSMPELIQRLETIRDDGYAVNDQELAVGPPLAGCARILLQRQGGRGLERLGAHGPGVARQPAAVPARSTDRRGEDQPGPRSAGRLQSGRGLREVRLKPVKATVGCDPGLVAIAIDLVVAGIRDDTETFAGGRNGVVGRDLHV